VRGGRDLDQPGGLQSERLTRHSGDHVHGGSALAAIVIGHRDYNVVRAGRESVGECACAGARSFGDCAVATAVPSPKSAVQVWVSLVSGSVNGAVTVTGMPRGISAAGAVMVTAGVTLGDGELCCLRCGWVDAVTGGESDRVGAVVGAADRR